MDFISFFLRHATCFISGTILFFALLSCNDKQDAMKSDDTATVYPYAYLFEDDWHAPDTSSLGKSSNDDLIRYGRELIVNTANYFGPVGKINHESNGMNCQNCHLYAGTKLYANSFSAVFANYPKFRARSGTVEDLGKRIDDCMERSLNGKKIPNDSKEKNAMIAYINWIGKGVAKNKTPDGAAVIDVPYLNRAADTSLGKIAYEKNCVTCHKINGEGQLNADGSFLYPPLWGNHSYNTAAGMYRLSRLAGFIKSNMPYLTSTHDKPILSDAETWDIAAYINSLQRPKKNFAADWHEIAKKPVDHPFGPYADSFSETRHKYGPFGIMKKSKPINTSTFK